MHVNFRDHNLQGFAVPLSTRISDDYSGVMTMLESGAGEYILFAHSKRSLVFLPRSLLRRSVIQPTGSLTLRL